MTLQYVRSAIVEDCISVSGHEEMIMIGGKTNVTTRCLFYTAAGPALLKIMDTACGSLTITKCSLSIMNKVRRTDELPIAPECAKFSVQRRQQHPGDGYGRVRCSQELRTAAPDCPLPPVQLGDGKRQVMLGCL